MRVGWVRQLLCITSALITVPAGAESTAILSVNAQGQAAGGVSNNPAISADGRFVAFQSSASDLVSGDTSVNKSDIFLYDRQLNSLTRVSVGLNGTPSNLPSSTPAISQDGRYVAFESKASNLVANDSNDTQDIFVYDRITAATVRVSTGVNNIQLVGECSHPVISGDGRFVAFGSAAKLTSDDINGVSDVFLHDRDPDQNGVFDETNSTTIRVSQSGADVTSPGISNFPVISRNGQYLAYTSADATLVLGDTNVRKDIFVYNIQTHATERVSVSSSGQQGDDHSSYASLSDDGRYVAFISAATNLVSGDSNLQDDVFVRDRLTNITTRASLSDTETQSAAASTNPVISGDGRYVSFISNSGSLTAKLAGSVAAAPVVFDAITAASGGGTGGATDVKQVIYRRDLIQQSTVRVSSNNYGAKGDGSMVSLAVSADGMIAAFASSASNLSCTPDANSVIDVFVRDMNTTTAPLCAAASATKSKGGGVLLVWTFIPLLAIFVFVRNRSPRISRL